jgi:death-on-curing protein
VPDPEFLTLAEVINLHADQIHRYGGSLGVRDLGLLESALAQPSASFGGAWLHQDLFEMAAAYAFHLCQNHPFIDGNKRIALVCALVFLELNRISPLDPKGRLKDAMLRVATGRMNKEALATLFRSLPKESKK